MIVPLGEKGFHETFIPVKPTLENDGKAKLIRIVISGIIVEKGASTNKALSAYLDLTIKP